MRTPIRAVAPLLSVAVLCLAAAPASGDQRAKSKIAIKKLKPGGASGKVSSKNPGCKGGKKVSLFRFDDFVSVKIEITKSKPSGTWRTKKDLARGRTSPRSTPRPAAGTRSRTTSGCAERKPPASGSRRAEGL